MLIRAILLLLYMNGPLFRALTGVGIWIYLVFGVLFIFFNLFPSFQKYPTNRIRILANGRQLLVDFMLTIAGNVVIVVWGVWNKKWEMSLQSELVLNLCFVFLAEVILFWNGILRVYATSLQLGMKWRIVGIVFGWIPILNILTLFQIVRLVSDEYQYELEKAELDAMRKESELCKTKYPILLVHGVFFRDFRFLNYWGRIPQSLMKNGATIYYGEQQSAASVEECGKELARRIKQLVEETGCEKVNIIAHSKGGLDARYAISCQNSKQYVASLTTINTPHRGCIFAEYLLKQVPTKLCNKVAAAYNATLRKFGDTNPDFMEAVTDLQAARCSELNQQMPNVEGIYYQSVGSIQRKARAGRFPLNMSYPLVRHFDGENDGLVAVESAKWGEKFTLITVKGNRGVSHGDLIDLNRENIKEFDVCEFYVKLVHGLKTKGM